MSQLSYPLVPAVAFAGVLYDIANNVVESVVNAEASLEIPFGVVVAQGADETKGILPAAAGAKLIGIAVHSHSYAPTFEVGTVGIKPKVMVSVLRRGRIWVRPEVAVVPGDRMFVRYAAGAGGTQLGSVRIATVASEMIDGTSIGVFRSTAGILGLAVLEVDFTNKP